MKFLAILFLCLAVSFPSLSCEEFESAMNDLEHAVAAHTSPSPEFQSPPFDKSFSSEQSLRQWAETSRMGGHVEEMDFQGEKLLIAYRSYTSGVHSSDVGIYASQGGKWTLVKSHPAIWANTIGAENHGDTIIFRTGKSDAANGKSYETVMVITAQDLGK